MLRPRTMLRFKNEHFIFILAMKRCFWKNLQASSVADENDERNDLQQNLWCCASLIFTWFEYSCKSTYYSFWWWQRSHSSNSDSWTEFYCCWKTSEFLVGNIQQSLKIMHPINVVRLMIMIQVQLKIKTQIRQYLYGCHNKNSLMY